MMQSWKPTRATVAPRRAGIVRFWARASAAVAMVISVAIFSFAVKAEPPGNSLVYTIAVGDRIAVTVVGQPEISGEMLVDDSGYLVVPFIGSIDVKNLTILQCQKLIHDGLADGFLRQPVVSVRLIEPRPIYVLGDVRSAGTFPFRYGSTVKNAVALAGGFGVTESVQSAAISEFLLAEERLRQLGFQKLALLVRQARLEAQLDGRGTFAPPVLHEPAEESEFADLVAAEKATLDSQAAILKKERDLARSQKPRVQAEIEATNAQIATVRNRLELLAQEVEQSTRLLKQGLGTHGTEVNFRLEQANQEERLWMLTAQVSRLQMESGELDIKVEELEAAFKKQILTELLDVHQRLAELNVTLPLAREIRDVKLQQAGGLGGTEVARSISVTRTRSGKPSVFEATEATPLEPGDIVEVRRLLPSERRRRNAGSEQPDIHSE